MPETLATLDLASLCRRVRDALSVTLGDELEIEPGLPNSQGSLSLSGPAALIALGLSPPSLSPPISREAWLKLDSALAINLVDRALGGRGQLGTASASSVISEAECGVLAYLAARATREFDGLWVRDTRATLEAPAQVQLQWPFSLRWHNGAGVAQLGWPDLAPDFGVACRLGWFGQLEARDREALAQGDLLTLDAPCLSVTTQGLSASVCLQVRGVREILQVSLDGTELRANRAQRHAGTASEVFVALLDDRLAVRSLTALVAGDCIVLPRAVTEEVSLHHGDRTLARGKLVRVAGDICMQLDRLT